MRVSFIQPMEFLRAKGGGNPYFDAIIRTVDSFNTCGVEYGVWIHKREYNACGYAYKRQYSTVCYWVKIVERISAMLHFDKYKSLWVAGAMARPFCRFWAASDIIVTIAGAFAVFLEGLNPKARVVDVEHGIIYSTHSGYFLKNGLLLPQYRMLTTREFWVYGKGFADAFYKNPENLQWLKGRVRIVGDLVRAYCPLDEKMCRIPSESSSTRKLIVVASQMTPDFEDGILLRMKKIYEDFLENVKDLDGVRVVFRQHPRFGNAIDLDGWRVRFGWVIFDDARTWDEMCRDAVCVATINSTCVFDAAAKGVPSILLDGTSLGWRNLMSDEYDYPFRSLEVNELLSMKEKEWESLCERVREWYNKYYTPFSSKRAERLLLGQEGEE